MGPALGVLEFESIALGIQAGDAMVKRSPVSVAWAGTVHPGKYLVLVGGEVAEVEEALDAGREFGGPLLDSVFLPHPHPDLPLAMQGRRLPGLGDALGIFETRTVASILNAADRALKGAEVELAELRLADDLGGKAYCRFQGDVADVEAAIELAVESLSDPAFLVARVVIPRLHDEMQDNFDRGSRFAEHLAQHQKAGT